MNVLAGTNGTPGSEKATEFAFAYCRSFNANFYVLYVVSTKSDEDKDKNIKNGMRVLGRLKIRGADLAFLWPPSWKQENRTRTSSRPPSASRSI